MGERGSTGFGDFGILSLCFARSNTYFKSAFLSDGDGSLGEPQLNFLALNISDFLFASIEAKSWHDWGTLMRLSAPELDLLLFRFRDRNVEP